MPSPRIRKMSLSRALDKYLKTVSIQQKIHHVVPGYFQYLDIKLN
ncbi:Uncharacterised protein [Shigella sonnei]|nr:Uncharacterised protein [Shigella sonnei]